jgi:hypothetical protein
MPDDVILRTRLQLLRHNLNEVIGVIAAVENVRLSLQRVLYTWHPSVDLERRLIDLENQANSARSYARGTPAEASLDAVIAGLGDLKKRLCSAEVLSAVHAINSRSMDLRHTELRTTIEDFLVRNATQGLRVIGQIEQKLDQAPGDPEASASAWAEYLKILPKAQEVFAEYVDLLAGLALRDSGYDRGICRIADELVHTFGRHGDIRWNSLTIPARRDALDMTMARIIRMGFPEWTLWALPLVAYGFGSVLVGNVREFTDFTEQVPEPGRAQVRVLLADAFATYVMGPAYACALMFLRLDPIAPEEPDERGLTQLRANIVLTVLERMSNEAEDRPYEVVLDRLRKQWEAATAQTRADPPPEPPVDVPELLKVVADVVWSRELPAQRWPRIDEWSQAMTRRQPLEPGSVDAFDDSLSHVLNAAWLARLGVHDGAGAVELAELAETARSYWTVIETARGRATNQLGAPYVPAQGGNAQELVPQVPAYQVGWR